MKIIPLHPYLNLTTIKNARTFAEVFFEYYFLRFIDLCISRTSFIRIDTISELVVNVHCSHHGIQALPQATTSLIII